MSLTSQSVTAAAEEAISAISSAADLDQLKQVRIDFIGDKSKLAKAVKLSSVPSFAQLRAEKRWVVADRWRARASPLGVMCTRVWNGAG